MLKFVIFACAFMVCQGLPKQPAPLTPRPASAAALSGISYGETPIKIFDCLGNPELIKKKISMKCASNLSPCDKMKCLFRESGWALPGDKVNKAKVSEHLDAFATEQPAWSAAVQHAKADCLDKDLLPQASELNCPAQDVMTCILHRFIRFASPSQWKATQECEYPKAFATSCPICPTDCYAPLIPIGSCNACLAVPRPRTT